MHNFDPTMFVAVLYEMLGPLLWLIAGGSAIATLVLAWLPVRDRGLVSRRFVASELVGILAGFAAVLFMQIITHSRLADVGGPVDWLLVALIWLIGVGGTTVLVYDLWGLWVGRERRVERRP